MADFLIFDFPDLPVGINKLYTVARGRKILTKAGRAYKNRFVSAGGGLPKQELLDFEANEEQEYYLELWFEFPFEDIYNLNWGKDGRVKSPFKDVDVDGPIKLAVDCIAAVVGIRDRANFSLAVHKRDSPDEQPAIVARLTQLDLEDDPFPAPRRR